MNSGLPVELLAGLSWCFWVSDVGLAFNRVELDYNLVIHCSWLSCQHYAYLICFLWFYNSFV